MAVGAVASTAHSCVALTTTSIGLSVLKSILLGGIEKGFGVFSDKNSFLENELINAALPQQLKQLNSSLESVGLSNLVKKEKEYIAEAAAFTVNISRPILVQAVNNLTTADAARIAQGGSGVATQILRERTSDQLISAITPKIDEKLNEYGIVQSLNSALKGTSLLGGIFGSGQNSSVTFTLSKLASQQMVNGLFNIIENHEKQNSATLLRSVQQPQIQISK